MDDDDQTYDDVNPAVANDDDEMLYESEPMYQVCVLCFFCIDRMCLIYSILVGTIFFLKSTSILSLDSDMHWSCPFLICYPSVCQDFGCRKLQLVLQYMMTSL